MRKMALKHPKKLHESPSVRYVYTRFHRVLHWHLRKRFYARHFPADSFGNKLYEKILSASKVHSHLVYS